MSRANKLIDPAESGLRQGVVSQGLVRRTLLAGETLLSLSDYEILALDLLDPSVVAPVVVGNDESLCSVGEAFFGRPFADGVLAGCQSVPGAPGISAAIIALAWAARRRCRRRRRSAP